MFRKISILSVIIFAIFATFSCDEEKDLMPTENTPDVSVLEKILAFKADVDSPTKSNDEVSVDDAVWIVEATLNYTHCITEEASVYENADIIMDSITIDFATANGSTSYQSAIDAYVSMNDYLISYASKLDYTTKKYGVADVEYKDGMMKCYFNVFVKNEEKIPQGPLADLYYDWKTGAGECDGGRCDGTHPEKNLMTVLETCLNYVQIQPNYYLTDIHTGLECFADQYPLGSDTLLLDTLSAEFSLCIESLKVRELYDNARILNSRYEVPENWAVARYQYDILRRAEGSLSRFFTYYFIKIGKTNYFRKN